MTDGKKFLSPKQVCLRYAGQITMGTLANWRTKGDGPTYTKIGGRVLYELQEILKWERKQKSK